MNTEEFKVFLNNNIPITEAMGIEVLDFTADKVKILAKLKPNKNHKATAFGGSISSLAIVCGWALVYSNIKPIDPDAHIVIQKSSIQYLKPIKNDFVAECILEDKGCKDKFIETYNKHGKARLKLRILCYDGENMAAEMEGQYVAFR